MTERPATKSEMAVALNALFRGLQPRKDTKAADLADVYTSALEGVTLTQLEGAIAKFLRGEVPKQSDQYCPRPPELARVARGDAAQAAAAAAPVHKDWEHNPARTYLAMVNAYGAAHAMRDNWPIINRRDHPAEWREWYAWYQFRCLWGAAALMCERSEKTVPAISPFAFDPEFERTQWEYPPVPESAPSFPPRPARKTAFLELWDKAGGDPSKFSKLMEQRTDYGKTLRKPKPPEPPPEERKIHDYSQDKVEISPVLAKQLEETARMKGLQAEMQGTEFDSSPPKQRKDRK